MLCMSIGCSTNSTPTSSKRCSASTASNTDHASLASTRTATSSGTSSRIARAMPEVVLELEADLDVDRLEPRVGALGGLRPRGLGRAVLGPDEPVERHVLGVQPAEELVHRAAVRLAADIPQRHLDRRDRAVAEIRVVVPAAV